MKHNFNILNLEVQGIDKDVVDVITAVTAFKSTLVFQKLHLVYIHIYIKKVTNTCPKYWKNYPRGKVYFQVV